MIDQMKHAKQMKMVILKLKEIKENISPQDINETIIILKK